MENRIFVWENSLFQWPFSIAMLVCYSFREGIHSEMSILQIVTHFEPPNQVIPTMDDFNIFNHQEVGWGVPWCALRDGSTLQLSIIPGCQFRETDEDSNGLTFTGELPSFVG